MLRTKRRYDCKFIEMRCRGHQGRNLGPVTDHRMGEPRIKWNNVFQRLDLLRRERDAQGLDIRLQVLDFPSSNYREDVRRLLHHVRDRDGRDVFRPYFFRDFLEGRRHFLLLFGAFPANHRETT